MERSLPDGLGVVRGALARGGVDDQRDFAVLDEVDDVRAAFVHLEHAGG